MVEWNVVVTTREMGFALACELLGKFGQVQVTEAIGYAGAKVPWLNGTYPRRWQPLSRFHAFNSGSINQSVN